MIPSILLTLGGLVLVVAEVLFPSLGVFGLSAAACMVGADWIAYAESPTLMWILLGAQLILVPVLVRASFIVLPKLPFGRGMLLPPPPPSPNSGVEESSHLLGRAGVALSDLRPAGTASFGDERRSVVSEMGLVPSGTPVTVVAVEGYRIVVRPSATASPRP